jgi:hypothetical protein
MGLLPRRRVPRAHPDSSGSLGAKDFEARVQLVVLELRAAGFQ